MSTGLLRENVAVAYETARSLALVRIADLGHAIAAWAEARDIDIEWREHTRAR